MAAAFESSELWRRTLAPCGPRDPHSGPRERLRSAYLLTRDYAAVLLGEASRSMPDFTVHDVTHVDALWETADLVCARATALTPAEAFVLGCAFILHDAAMGLSAYSNGLQAAVGPERWRDLLGITFVHETGRWPDEAELSDPPEEVLRECTTRAIRETHATQAAKLVDQAWTTNAGNAFHLLQDTQLREAYGPLIGDLAMSHWWDVEQLTKHFMHAKGSLSWQPAEWIVDPLKLACILRLADATQIDSRRAPTFLFALRSPDGHSRDHWKFQEHLSRPRLVEDRVTYAAFRPFERKDANAWWLALDYLRSVDSELKKVDALLHDLGRPRLAARAVAGVDSPERFSHLFPVRGWLPVDTGLRVSDIQGVIAALGGEQLYGKDAEVAVRELLQNAQDAIQARQLLDSDYNDGRVDVTLTESEDVWVLEVRDNGVGMDEGILVHSLLDFGSTGWRVDAVRSRFPGLIGGGFRPKGRFGVGFFSVFILGDDVEIVTRRFDGGHNDARRLRFSGLSERPILTQIGDSEHVPPGTTVRVTLSTNPYDKYGMFRHSPEERVDSLVLRLAPENAAPIRTVEWQDGETTTLPPFSAASATPEQVFDRLYPPRRSGGRTREEQRIELRAEFARRATEVLSPEGGRIGLAVLGRDLLYFSQFNCLGIVLVNGLRSDEHQFFAGYLDGKPSRASRDRVEFVAGHAELREWVHSQEMRLRELGLFTEPVQLELSFAIYRTVGSLSDDHCVAMTSDGLLTATQISAWAAGRSEIFFSNGWPLTWQTRPPAIKHYLSGQTVELAENWLMACSYYFEPVLDDSLDGINDPEYEAARYDPSSTWQKTWWETSAYVQGLVIKEIAAGWGCSLRDILEPIEARNWSDYASTSGFGRLPVFHLRRPDQPSR